MHFNISNLPFLQQYSDSKSYCEDLTEGKFSFPVIHAINTKPDDQQVISILNSECVCVCVCVCVKRERESSSRSEGFYHQLCYLPFFVFSLYCISLPPRHSLTSFCQISYGKDPRIWKSRGTVCPSWRSLAPCSTPRRL